MATGKVNVGSTPGKRIVNIFVQLTTPSPRRIGDIWIKSNENLNVRNALFREGSPVRSIPNNVPYIQLRGARIKSLGGDGLGFAGVDDIIFGDETVAESDTIAFWTDKKYVIRGKYDFVITSINGVVNNNNASFWNGIEWVDFSWKLFLIYFYGTEPLTPFEFIGTSGGAVDDGYLEKNKDHLRLYVQGRGISVSTAATVSTIEVTDLSKLFVRWVNLGTTASNDVYSHIGLTTATSTDFVRETSRMRRFEDEEVAELDITDLSGFFKVQLRVRQTRTGTAGNGNRSDLRVYEIWAE